MPRLRAAVAAGVVLVAAGLSAFALSGLVRRGEREGELRKRRARVVAEYREVLLRHPDVNLSQERGSLERYLGRGERRQLRDLAALEEELDGLRRRLLITIVGDAPEAATHYKTFTPNGFRRFFDSLELPGVTVLSAPPVITGDAAADGRVRELAEARGYRLRPVAEEGGLTGEGRLQLQREAWDAWQRLTEAAAAEGIRLGMVSGFRSVERQRAIFLGYLREEGLRERGRSFTEAEIASGAADGAIERVLKTSSVPGYSKHHTGYALDITDLGSGLSFVEFGRTAGYRWISADNYLNAKRCGFIPSYPQGASRAGPDPEPWELVWVGEAHLLRGEEGQ